MIIDGYQLTKELFQNNNFKVYKAIDANGKFVILKVLPDELVNPLCIRLLEQELKVATILNPEYVAMPIMQAQFEGGYYLVYEDNNAVFLSDYIQEANGTQSKEEILEKLDLAIKIAKALTAVHEAGMIHRDLRPQNIIIETLNNEVKICGLGMSSELDLIANSDSLVLNDDFLAYVSPEQTGRVNRLVDTRSDFYSLGIVFYELFTGIKPYSATNSREWMHCHIAQVPKELSDVNSYVSEFLSAIIMKLQEKSPDRRYQSTYGLIADLESYYNTLLNNLNTSNLILGQKDVANEFRTPHKLYARSNELKVLTDCLSDVKAGGRKLVFVEGSSGIGKTALVNQMFKNYHGFNISFVAGSFEIIKDTIPYNAILEALKRMVSSLLKEGKAELLKIRHELEAVLDGNAQLMVNAIPELELIIGKQKPMTVVPNSDLHNRFLITVSKFISVFAKKNQPFVLFLDDVQWADNSSIELVEALLGNIEIESLLVILALRTGDEERSIELTHLLAPHENKEYAVKHLNIDILDNASIFKLVQDVYKCTDEDCERLTKILVYKTNGNPFFLIEFLGSLYAQKYATFDYKKGLWTFNFQAIHKEKLASNVVDLIGDKYVHLSQETKDLLGYASCIGMGFSLEELKIICQKPDFEIVALLKPAVDERLIVGFSSDNIGKINSFQFLHDKIRLLVYEGISTAVKKSMHLHIGRSLLKMASDEENKDDLYSILRHFFIGKDELGEQEKNEVAELCWSAYRKSLDSGSYDISYHYAIEGIQLLAEFSWTEDFDLSKRLYLAAAEAAALNGAYDEMYRLLDVVKVNVSEVEDQAKIFKIEIYALISQNQIQKAIHVAQKLFRILGLKFPQKPTIAQTLIELIRTYKLLLGIKNIRIDKLPIASDEKYLLSTEVMGQLVSVLYRSNPYLLVIVICRLIQNGLRKGITPVTPVGFTTFALLINAFFNNIDKAYTLGRIGMDLFNLVPSSHHWSQAYYIYNVGVRFWKEPIRLVLNDFMVCYQKAQEDGDFETMQSAAVAWVNYSVRSGVKLSEIKSRIKLFDNSLRGYNQEIVDSQLGVARQFIENFTEERDEPAILKGKGYDEKEMIAYHQAEKDDTSLFVLYANKAILAFSFDKFSDALSYINLCRKYKKAAAGIIMMPVFYFYEALIHAQLVEEKSKLEKSVKIVKLFQVCKKFKKWSQNSPENFEAKYLLIKAIAYKLQGNPKKAIFNFDAAVVSAEKEEHFEMVALCRELYGAYLLKLNSHESGILQIQKAIEFYFKWGAVSKSSYLKEKYGIVKKGISIGVDDSLDKVGLGDGNTLLNFDSSIELSTVLDASQAISSEIILSRLISKTIKIIIEFAGAQKGVLFLVSPDNGQLSMEAVGVVKNDGLNISLNQYPLWEKYVPASVIRYVERAERLLLLNNANVEGDFVKDPYIIKNNVKSIITFPIIHQSKNIGILYLENNLSTDVFTQQRVTTLSLLSSQLAVSLENARLFHTMDQKVHERTVEISEKNLKLLTQKEELEKVGQQLKELNATKDRFFSIIAHDLRGPLGTSTSLLDIVMSDFDDFSDVELKNFLNNLKYSTEQTFKLLDDLLLWARSQRKEISIHPKLQSINEIVNNTIEVCEQSAKKKKVSIRFVAQHDYQVGFDKDMIATVLRNVMSNAVKYVGEGGEIIIVVEKVFDAYQVSVKDNGVGMPESLKKKLFSIGEKNISRVGTDGEKGTGLGLILCHDFIQQHKGRIWVESKPGKGTTVNFTLPC